VTNREPNERNESMLDATIILEKALTDLQEIGTPAYHVLASAICHVELHKLGFDDIDEICHTTEKFWEERESNTNVTKG